MPELRIVIEKSRRTLILYDGENIELEHAAVLGRNSAADKAVEGDEATPIGEYFICAKNPRSKFFLSMCLSYPNAEDAERGLAAGVISPEQHAAILDALRLHKMPPQYTGLGGEIYIHGEPAAGTDGRAKDWTRGCIAVSNGVMQELYRRVPLRTPVLINR